LASEGTNIMPSQSSCEAGEGLQRLSACPGQLLLLLQLNNDIFFLFFIFKVRKKIINYLKFTA
jgi:hypothetical protein